MSNPFSDLFSKSNNPKLDEMLSKTRDVAEILGKKSAEHLDLSRKKVELFDMKTKLSKLYEKFGKQKYNSIVGLDAEDESSEDFISKITEINEKISLLEEEIDAAKAKFSEAVQRTKETFQKEMEKAAAPKAEVDVSEFFETEDDE
ncbi:MAG: hypothetical protein NC213_02960 [Acetobacter sp.]|nr:hypothetical protein [Bacteroides sp.]MCM1340682.1 hypothetical protein [Acetobacter sp.]MCM1433793.1 hypothetical protein [Clostridiales bacterium]